MANFLSQVSSAVPTSHSVTYSCTFTNNWSADNHPFNYPSDAHWSPPLIAAHGQKYKMWGPDILATRGVELVAEGGSTFLLEKEIKDARKEQLAGDFVKGGVQFNNRKQSQTLNGIKLTPWFDRMSSITMVAPSPDWYTGFYDLQPIDSDSMVWLESFEVATFPWDAGTEKGDDLDCDNKPEKPHVRIQQLTKEKVPDNGILLSPDKTEVLPMATWTCTLTSSACADHDEVTQGGKDKRNCVWAGKNNNKRDKRCKKKFLKERLTVWCPEACGVCEAEA